MVPYKVFKGAYTRGEACSEFAAEDPTAHSAYLKKDWNSTNLTTK